MAAPRSETDNIRANTAKIISHTAAPGFFQRFVYHVDAGTCIIRNIVSLILVYFYLFVMREHEETNLINKMRLIFQPLKIYHFALLLHRKATADGCNRKIVAFGQHSPDGRQLIFWIDLDLNIVTVDAAELRHISIIDIIEMQSSAAFTDFNISRRKCRCRFYVQFQGLLSGLRIPDIKVHHN